MDIAGQLILGLGLFFLGMQQVGANLRRLSGPSFRRGVAQSTGSPFETGLLGVVFGALMQSATAVTFILVSMVSSGLLASRAALPIITWTNVGLTALAFIVTLNIHPIVAYLVGLSAVFASMVRKPAWQAAAGVVLGIGLIFFGLETMGGAAHPLVAMSWFHELLTKTTESPAVAFLVGVAVAAILQSNTASTLLVITLAGAGAFGLEPALMLIYGTNLGAIALRLVLAADMHGVPLQLVRFEDLFCVVSGVIMVALFYLETLCGVPLVCAALTHITPHLKTQLALGFLASNLLPAIAMAPMLNKYQALLSYLWPPTAEEGLAKPKYITRSALGDPATALDLLKREITRLLDGIGGMLTFQGSPQEGQERFAALGQLSQSITEFTGQLSAQAQVATGDNRFAALREELTLAEYLRENVQQMRQSLAAVKATPAGTPVAAHLAAAAAQLLKTAVQAASTTDAKVVEALRDAARQGGPAVDDAQQFCRQQASSMAPTERAAVNQALDDLKMIAWILHRLSKLLADLTPAAQ